MEKHKLKTHRNIKIEDLDGMQTDVKTLLSAELKCSKEESGSIYPKEILEEQKFIKKTYLRTRFVIQNLFLFNK